MQASRARTALGLGTITAFLVSLLLMFTLGGGFDSGWFWTSFAASSGLLVAIFAAIRPGGSSAETELVEQVEAPADEMEEAEPETSEESGEELPPPTTPVSPAALAAIARGAPELAGFSFREHTLYERKVGRNTVRFFSKPKPKVGTPIGLPDGFTPVWDSRQRKPILRAVEPPAPAAAPRLAPVPGRPAAAAPTLTPIVGKQCAAMVGLGEFCGNSAAEGAKYCKRHAKWKASDVDRLFEVRTDRRAPARGRALRATAPTFEIRTAKPKPTRALRAREPILEIRTARGKAGRPLRVREPAVEVRLARPKAARALRLRDANVEVRVAKPKVKPWPRDLVPKDFEVRKPKSGSGKALRNLANLLANPTVVVPKGHLGEPVRPSKVRRARSAK